MVAVCLTLLLAIMAIAIDGGVLLDDRRQAQATADAAALAAATDMYNNYPTNKGYDLAGTARASALRTAADNGYTNDTSTSIVTVRVPGEKPVHSSPSPITDGSGFLSPGFIEVIVEYKQPRAFSRIFASSHITVSARAVAQGGTQPSTPPGIILLEPTAEFPLKVTGNGILTVPNAAVIVNSNHSRTIQHSGNGPIAAKAWQLTGNPGYISSGSGTVSGPIHTSVPPTPDPLRHLPYPDRSSLTLRASNKTSISSDEPVVLSPGIYQKGISISGNGAVTLMPGIYYIEGGGLQISGNGNITMNGVMLFNTGTSGGFPPDKVQISGNGSLNWTPMSSGIYQGMALFQDRSLDLEVYTSGNGSTKMVGTMYAPNSMFHVSGNGDVGVEDYLGSTFIARTMQVSGQSKIIIGSNPDGIRAPLRVIRLVQ